MEEELWIARDKDGTVHFSNIELIKPSVKNPNNPNANDEIFVPIHIGNCNNGSMIFYLTLDEDSPMIPDDLTFENSPKKIKKFITQ